MHKEMGLLLVLVLLVLSDQVNCECRMNIEYIQDSNSTFTKEDVHGKLQLQRFNFVDEGVILELLCKVNGKMQSVYVDCRSGSLNPVEPVQCNQPIEAEVRETDPDHFCLATMYRIGFEINQEFFELYRVCYDKDSVQSHFSDATIYWKEFHQKLENQPFFTADGLILQDQAASFDSEKIYTAFDKIYGKMQVYIQKSDSGVPEEVINRGHLTAPSDMIFNDQMISTFKYLNVVPQFKSINNGTWLRIEQWIHENIPKESLLKVRTGALGVLSLPDFHLKRTMQPAFLIPDKKQNPVPEWMYKIVRNANNQLLQVFLTYNNIFNAEKPIPYNCCKTIQCPQDLDVEGSPELGFGYCCDPENFVQCLPHN